ncbi:MAG: glutathione S-transferase family protein, partial [Pseudomonadota bacterium]
NYSSWSLRIWLLMKVAGIEFEEKIIPIYTQEGKAELQALSAAAKVPLLFANEQMIWDSLAIAEYLAEQHPEKALWPLANDSRAIARAVTSEMHSGFAELRDALPMNCRKVTTLDTVSESLQMDIDRICQIWRDCREQFGQQGDFLFSNFSIADAFYAPIAMRFYSYGIVVGKEERQYMDTLLALNALQEWIAISKQDDLFVERYEQV